MLATPQDAMTVPATPVTVNPPTDVDVDGLLRSLQAGQSAAVAAADGLLQLSAAEPHPRVKAALLERAARLVMAEDRARAVNLLRESFRLFPTHGVGHALVGLAENEPVLQRLFRWGNLVDAVAALAPRGAEQAEAQLQAARSHVAQGQGVAAKAALRSVLALHPDHKEALELQAVADQQAADRAEALTERRLALAECADDERAEALVAYAELLLAGAEPLSDAAAALADAVDAGAAVETVAPLWVEVARAMGDDAELTRALACSLTAGEALPTRLQHADELANIASIDRKHPQAAGMALAALAEVLADDPQVTARLEVVGALLEDDPDAAVEVIRARTAKDRDRVGEATACLALAWRAHQRGDWTTAEKHYRRVRTLAPQEPEAQLFFEQFYRQAGDHKKLLVALSQRLGTAEGREAVEVALEIGALSEGPLAAPDRAIEAYQRVLTVQPDQPEALAALQRLHAAQGRWSAVTEVLDRVARSWLVRSEIDPGALDHAVAALVEMAAMAQDPHRLNAPGEAIALWRRVLQVQPAHAEAVQAVAQNLEQQRHFADLADLLRTAARHTTDTSAAAALLTRAGQVLNVHLGRPAEAAELWRQALSLQPGHEEAAAALKAVARSIGTPPERLAAALEDLAAVLDPQWLGADGALPDRVDAAHAPALAAAVALAEQAGESGTTIGQLAALWWMTAPNEAAARQALTTAWRTTRTAQLADVVTTQLPFMTDETAHVDALRLLAELQTALGQTQAAQETMAAVLALRPDDPEARRAQLQQATATGDIAALRAAVAGAVDADAQFVEAALTAAADTVDVRRFALWQAAAATLADAMGDAERAVAVLAEAVTTAMGAEELPLPAEDLRALAVQLGHAARAAAMPGGERLALEAQLAWAATDDAPAIRLQVAAVAQRTGDLDEAAELAGTVAEDALTAGQWVLFGDATALLLALAADESDDAAACARLQRLMDLLDVAGSDAATREGAGEMLCARWLQVGLQFVQRGERWAEVLAAVKQGLQVAETEELLNLLEAAASETGDRAGALDAARRLAARLPADQVPDGLLRAAMIIDGDANFAKDAEGLYREVLTLRADDRDAWAGLLAAVRSQGDLGNVAVVLDQLLAQPTIGRDTRLHAALERIELAAQLEESDPLRHAWPIVAGLAAADALTDAETQLLAMATAQLDVEERAGDVARKLLPVLEKHGEPADLLRACEVIAATATDDRTDALLTLAATRERVQHDVRGALAAAGDALQRAPQDNAARALVDRLALELLSTEGPAACDVVANVYEQAAATAQVAELRLQLRRTALSLLDDGSPSAVVRPLLQGVLADDPADDKALQRLDQFAEEAGDATARLALLALRADRTTDATAAAALHVERAHLAESLGQLDVAQAAWHQAAATGDADVRMAARAALVDLAERSGDVEQLVAALDALRDETTDEDAQVALHLRAVGALQDAGRTDAAQARLAAAVQALPHATELRDALDAALQQAGDHAGLVRHLDGAWTQQGDNPLQAEAVAARWLAAVQAAHGVSAELAHAAIRLLDAGLAAESAEQALDAVAAELQDAAVVAPALHALIARRASRDDAAGEVAARLQLLMIEPDIESAARRRRLAQLFATALDDRAAALEQRQALLELPDWQDDDAAALLADADAVGEATAVEGVLAIAVDLLDDADRRRRWQLQLVERAAERGDADRAMAALDQLAGAGQDDPAMAATRAQVSRKLARSLAKSGSGIDALDILFGLAEASDQPLAELQDALDVAQLANLTEDWLDRTAELIAAGTLPESELLTIVALAASTATELGLTERAADLWDLAWDQRPDDVETREAVLAMRREAGDAHRLAAALERALVFASQDDKVALRLELAQLKLHALGRPREALRLVLDILTHSPQHAEALALAHALADNPVCADEALAFLEPLLRTAKDWHGLQQVLQRRLARATSPTAKAELAQQIAHLQGELAGTATAGADTVRNLWSAMQAAPSLPLLELLESSCLAGDDDATLSAAYGLALQQPLDDLARVGVLQRAAQLAQRRGLHEEAEQRLRDAVEVDPASDQLFEALEALLEDQSRYAELLELWQWRLPAVVEPDSRRAALHRMAGLARALERRDAAIQAYEALADLDPQDLDPIAALVELLRDEAEPQRLANGLIRLAKATLHARDRAELFCEAARLQPKTRDGQRDVEECYQAAMDADASLDEPFVWLERHVHDHPRQLATLLETRLAALPAGHGRVLVLRKLAQVQRDLGESAEACASLLAAHDEDTSNLAVLDELLRTAEQLHQWQAWLHAAERRLAQETRKDVRIALLAQAARVLATELDEPARAEVFVQEIKQLAPNDPALRQLQALLLAHGGNPAQAAAGLEQVLKETTDPQELLALHLQLADLYQGPLDNPGKAIRELQRVLTLDPKRFEDRRRLCALYRSRQSYEALAESLKQWLAAMDEAPSVRVTMPMARGRELVDLLTELGQTLILIGNVQEAAVQLRKAYELGGHDLAVDAALAPLLEATGEAALAATLYDWMAANCGIDKARISEYLSKAALLLERQGDLQGARERLKRALELAPGNDEATLGSARVCLGLGDIDRAIRLFDAIARKHGEVDTQLRGDAHFGMGQCRLARNQRDQARACFEQAMTVVPGHKAAAEALAKLG